MVVAWLKAQHWTVYQEVQIETYGRRADIVAVCGNLTWVVEVKKSCGLDLLGQALYWNRYSNFTSVASPHVKSHGSTRIAKRFFFDRSGIGCIIVRPDQGIVEETIAAKIQKRAFSSRLKKSLNDAQKSFAPAGNAEGLRWTPFSQTISNFTQIVRKNQGSTLNQILSNLDHHYASTSSARATLMHWLKNDLAAEHGERLVIPGVRIEKDGRAYRLYIRNNKG